MRLKSLVLSGFKSFPNRTVINFSKGISAIVGPNGSGKSNIVDAIRFVLGEQNVRLLRARRIEELIFSGNGKAPEAARVRLQLDDCKDFAPPELKDFSEISIERMVFRDGSSRFLLNGKNCRLKEIRYLFLDTGAGTRAYSIIDQGRVEEFVNMTEEERRGIVEEVAGISRYRERRSQALFRLKTTKENLERLEDVIIEVKRQANSLKRQAQKAKRFVKLREEEEVLKKKALILRWTSLTEEEKRVKERLKEESFQKDIFKAEIEDINLKISTLDIELEELFLREKELRERESKVKNELDELMSNISKAEKGLAVISQKKEALNASIDSFEKRIKNAGKNISKIEKELSVIDERLSEIDKKLKEISKKEKEKSHKRNLIKRKREELQNSYIDISSKLSVIRSKIGGFNQRRDTLNEKIKRLSLKEKELEGQRENLELEKEDLKRDIDKNDKRISRLKEEILYERKEYEETEKELNRLQGRLLREREEFKEKEIGLKALQGLFKSGALFLDSTKRLLEKYKGTRPLFDFIDVEKGYEDLVEAALNELLKAIVPDDLKTLFSILKDIKNGGKDFSGLRILSLYHFDWEKDPEPGISPDSLSSKIRGDTRVATFLRKILSDWKVRPSILELLDSYGSKEGQNFFITEDGFILTPFGEIRPVFFDETENILIKKRKIHELKKDLNEIDKRLRVLKEKVLLLEKTKKQQEKRLLSKEREFNGLKSDIFKKKELIQRITSKIEGIDDRISLFIYERDEALNELSEIDREFEGFLEEERRLLKDEREYKERLEHFKKELDFYKKELLELNKEKNRLLLDQRGLFAKKEHLFSEKKRLESSIIHNENELSSAKKHLKEFLEEEKAIKKRLFEKRELFADIKIRYEGLNKGLDEITEKMDILREKRILLDKEKQQKQSKLSSIINKVNEIKIALSKIAEKKEYLLEKSLQEFRRDISHIKKEFSGAVEGEKLFDIEKKIRSITEKLDGFGPVNLTALEEYNAQRERLEFLEGQKKDLLKSISDINEAIAKIDRTSSKKFKEAINQINKSLLDVFSTMFDGGKAWLSLSDEKAILDSGVRFNVQIPGKRISSLSLLSGGEKALCAISLIFAIFFIKPTPFCILDEVDAPLDEANTIKFNSLLKRVSLNSQVILVTHNQRVMETADCLYGVTMEERGISKMVSVELN